MSEQTNKQKAYDNCGFCIQVYSLMRLDKHLTNIDIENIAKHMRQEHNINQEWITI